MMPTTPDFLQQRGQTLHSHFPLFLHRKQLKDAIRPLAGVHHKCLTAHWGAMNTHRPGIANEDFGDAKGVFLAMDTQCLEDSGHALSGHPSPVGPRVRAQHLVTVEELLVGLPKGVTSTTHTNVLHQADDNTQNALGG